MCATFAALSWLLATSTLGSDEGLEQAPLAVPIEGAPYRARLIQIDSQWNVVLQTRGTTRKTVPASQLVRWGSQRDRSKGPQILLCDGSILVADVLDIRGDQLLIGVDYDRFGDVPLWEESEIPLRFVRGILYQPPLHAFQRDRLVRRVLQASSSEDQLLLDNGDVLRGVLVSPTGPRENDEDEEDAIWLKTAGQNVPVPRSKVAALIFNTTLLETPPADHPLLRLGFRDGSCLTVSKIQPDNKLVRLTLPGEYTLSMAADTMWSKLQYLRPGNDRITYLSDLDPLDYRHFPFLRLSWPYHRDGNTLGTRLRWGGILYDKGLGMHSAARLAYDLNQRYLRFEAELAIDQQAGAGGSVIFGVHLLDEQGQWRAAYQSPIVRGQQPPLAISVDVQQARRMVLTVQYADRGDELDYANWLNARLVR